MQDRIGLLGYLTPILVGALAILATLAPVGGGVADLPGPHFLWIVVGLWCARRAEALSPLIIFLLAISHEALRAGPLGLETLALLIASEALRTSPDRRRLRSFAFEWGAFAAAVMAMELGVWAVMTATLSDPPPFSAMAARGALTVAAYPLVMWALLSTIGLGRRRDRDGFLLS